MKVLLLVPPTDLKRSYGKLKRFSNPQPSIGIAYIAAVLRENGYDVKVVDAYVNESNIEEILDMVERYSPDVIGISLLTASADVVYEISAEIRRRFPHIKIVMGNIHASIFSDEILSKDYADFIVHREGELTMLELLRALESGSNFENVNGISFKKGGAVKNNPPRPYMADLDTLPYPAWDLFPLDRYSTDTRSELRKGTVPMEMLATRGCPFQCTFCSSKEERSLGSKYRMRRPKAVVDEMVYMDDRYGKDTFSFMDLVFPLVREHAFELCDEIIKRGYGEKFRWHTECRPKSLDQDLLIHMRKAGCVRLYLGIESGNDEALKMLKKSFTTEDVRKTINMAHKAGIEVDGMFMIGLPGETEEMLNRTVDFAIELDVRYAIFNIFVPYPGCELWDTLSKEGRISYNTWSDFTSYPTYSGGEPVYVPDGLTKERLMELQSQAMRKFYLRPRFIIDELKRFKIDKIGHYIEGLKGVLKGDVSHCRDPLPHKELRK